MKSLCLPAIQFLLVSAVCIAGEAHCSPQCEFEIFLEHTENLDSKVVRDVSDNGEFCGYFSPDVTQLVFRFADGEFQVLSSADGFPNARCVKINNDGVIVGQVYPNGTGGRAAIWIEADPIVLPPPPGLNIMEAVGVNDSGMVVGTASSTVFPYVEDAFTWSEDTPEVLHLNRVFGTTFSIATAVNNQGVVVGYCAYDGGSFLDSEMFLYDGVSLDLICREQPGLYLEPLAINNNNEVVGLSRRSPIEAGLPWKYSGGSWIDLDLPPGTIATRISEINDRGYVVGACQNSESQFEPVLWIGSKYYMLREAAVNPSDFNISQRVSINEHSEISTTLSRGGLEAGQPGVLVPVYGSEADFNFDCQVDVDDLLELLAAWGRGDENLDIDGSGEVGVEDLLLLLAEWTSC